MTKAPKKPTKRVTVVDVARAAGVSAGTVSNAISGKRKVDQETQRRIREAVETLGYRPNLAARRMRTGRTNTIAIYSAMPIAVAAGASKLGFLMEIAASAAVAALEANGDDWAAEQVATLRTKSPETVKVALRQVREGGKMATFEDNMRMEYRIGWRKVQSHDFLEGVRAVIIDKDNDPKWRPSRLEDVSDEDIAKYFEPLGPDELTFGD